MYMQKEKQSKTIVLTELQHRQIEENSKTKVQAFQRKIYLKSRQNPNYRFYCLYDKVFRKDFLIEAYRKVKANQGVAGIDKTTFKDLEGKEETFIDEIHQELKAKTYKPSRLKEVEIPKTKGKTRKIRIPTIKDRVVQMALKMVIEPIFEADFEDNSFGYRPKKSAQQAIGRVGKELFKDIYRVNKREIKSADLSDCFNTIPHPELMRAIARRINDRQVLKLVKMIVKTGVLEKGSAVKKDKSNKNNGDKQDKQGNNKRGTPQGGVISPLLANIYLDKLDKYWKENSKISQMTRYADDFVILLHKKEEKKFNEFLEFLERDLKLKVNREKTKTETLKEGVNFLGFTMREKTSKRQKQYLSIEPNLKACKKIRESIKLEIKHRTGKKTEETINRINRKLRGWQEYFDNICMGKTREKINRYTELKVARMISKNNKREKICWKLFGNKEIYKKYALYKMKNLGRKFT